MLSTPRSAWISPHHACLPSFLNIPLSEAVEQLAPPSIHLHLVDGIGVDGEGVQVGEGDVDWAPGQAAA